MRNQKLTTFVKLEEVLLVLRESLSSDLVGKVQSRLETGTMLKISADQIDLTKAVGEFREEVMPLVQSLIELETTFRLQIQNGEQKVGENSDRELLDDFLAFLTNHKIGGVPELSRLDSLLILASQIKNYNQMAEVLKNIFNELQRAREWLEESRGEKDEETPIINDVISFLYDLGVLADSGSKAPSLRSVNDFSPPIRAVLRRELKHLIE